MTTIDKIITIFKKYGDDIKQLKKGESIDVECPLCGNRLHINSHGYNDHHLYIYCDGGCILINPVMLTEDEYEEFKEWVKNK